MENCMSPFDSSLTISPVNESPLSLVHTVTSLPLTYPSHFCLVPSVSFSIYLMRRFLWSSLPSPFPSGARGINGYVDRWRFMSQMCSTILLAVQRQKGKHQTRGKTQTWARKILAMDWRKMGKMSQWGFFTPIARYALSTVEQKKLHWKILHGSPCCGSERPGNLTAIFCQIHARLYPECTVPLSIIITWWLPSLFTFAAKTIQKKS